MWDKDDEIEFRVLMCASVDQEGPMRVAWGPNNEKLFVFSVQTWVVFVQWEKVPHSFTLSMSDPWFR